MEKKACAPLSQEEVLKRVGQLQAFREKELQEVLNSRFPGESAQRDLSDLARECVAVYCGVTRAFAETYLLSKKPESKGQQSSKGQEKSDEEKPKERILSEGTASLQLDMGFAVAVNTPEGKRVQLPGGEVLLGGRFAKHEDGKTEKLPNASIETISKELEALHVKEVKEAEMIEAAESKTHAILSNAMHESPVEEFRHALSCELKPTRPWPLHDSVIKYSKRHGMVPLTPGADMREVPRSFQYTEKLRKSVALIKQPYNCCSTRVAERRFELNTASERDRAEVLSTVWSMALFLLAIKRGLLEAGAEHQVLESKIDLGLALLEIGEPTSDPAKTLLDSIGISLSAWNNLGQVLGIRRRCVLCATKTDSEAEKSPCAVCGTQKYYGVAASLIENNSPDDELITRRLMTISRFCAALPVDLRRRDSQYYRLFVTVTAPQLEAFGVPGQIAGKYPRWESLPTLCRFLYGDSNDVCMLRVDLIARTNLQFIHWDMLSDPGSSVFEAARFQKAKRVLDFHLPQEANVRYAVLKHATSEAGLSEPIVKGVFRFLVMEPKDRWVGFGALLSESKQTDNPLPFVRMVSRTPEEKEKAEWKLLEKRVSAMNSMAEQRNAEFCAKRGIRVSAAKTEKGEHVVTVEPTSSSGTVVAHALRSLLVGNPG